MTKDEALKLAKVCIQASLEYKRGNATAVEAVEDIDAMLAQPEQKDAARYQHIKGMARAMSLDISGNHYWHMTLGAIRGPNLDEAIDRAIEAELKENT